MSDPRWSSPPSGEPSLIFAADGIAVIRCAGCGGTGHKAYGRTNEQVITTREEKSL